MLGNNIKSARKRLKLTQKELAQKLGIAEITIRKYEKGDREPNFDTIQRLALALNITPYELLSDYASSSSNNNSSISDLTNNLSLLIQSTDEDISKLSNNLKILIDNLTANALNKYNVHYNKENHEDYIQYMNRILDKLALIANPMYYIHDSSHTQLLKDIDDYMNYKINQFNEEEV